MVSKVPYFSLLFYLLVAQLPKFLTKEKLYSLSEISLYFRSQVFVSVFSIGFLKITFTIKESIHTTTPEIRCCVVVFLDCPHNLVQIFSLNKLF